MEKLAKFFDSDAGKIIALIAGVGLLLLFVKVATPNTLNIFINSGKGCTLSSVPVKKAAGKKAKKDKKN